MSAFHLLLGCIAAFLLAKLIYRLGYWAGVGAAVAYYEAQPVEHPLTTQLRESAPWN